MKILFTADEHLYLRTKGVDKEWLANRFKKFIELTSVEEIPHDIRVHGGDFFDTMPNIEELAIFLEYANNVTVPTYIIDGNHEATKKGKTFLTTISSMITNPLFIITDIYYQTDWADFLPYCELKNFAKEPEKYDPGSKLLFTHVRGEIPPHVKPEVDLSLFDKWEKVYAGDLHSVTNSQRNISYPGSPMSTSRARTIPKATHGCYLIDADSLAHEWISLDGKLPHLLRLPLGQEVDDTYHNVVYEANVDHASESVAVEGKVVEKVVKEKASVSSLGLSKASLFEDYMIAYMKQRLDMKHEEINTVISLYGSIT